MALHFSSCHKLHVKSCDVYLPATSAPIILELMLNISLNVDKTRKQTLLSRNTNMLQTSIGLEG